MLLLLAADRESLLIEEPTPAVPSSSTSDSATSSCLGADEVLVAVPVLWHPRLHNRPCCVLVWPVRQLLILHNNTSLYYMREGLPRQAQDNEQQQGANSALTAPGLRPIGGRC